LELKFWFLRPIIQESLEKEKVFRKLCEIWRKFGKNSGEFSKNSKNTFSCGNLEEIRKNPEELSIKSEKYLLVLHSHLFVIRLSCLLKILDERPVYHHFFFTSTRMPLQPITIVQLHKRSVTLLLPSFSLLVSLLSIFSKCFFFTSTLMPIAQLKESLVLPSFSSYSLLLLSRKISSFPLPPSLCSLLSICSLSSLCPLFILTFLVPTVNLPPSDCRLAFSALVKVISNVPRLGVQLFEKRIAAQTLVENKNQSIRPQAQERRIGVCTSGRALGLVYACHEERKENSLTKLELFEAWSFAVP
jgi:hypothetical protein